MLRSSHGGLLAVGGGAAALTLAALGEFQRDPGSSLVLYGLAILIFAASARLVPRAVADVTVSESEAEPRRSRSSSKLEKILIGGTILSIALELVALRLLGEDLASRAGTRLWLAGLMTLAATAVALRRIPGWPPRWGSEALPTTARGRWLLALALVVVLALAAVSRLVSLDRVPFGINPDEGDRAAEAIQIIRGTHTRAVLETGWYRISMVYFWLLAQVMKVIGIGYAQARVFGALAGILSVAAITWIGVRQFGPRVGLLAGALLSVLGVSLQFARETSEAGPTGALWAISMAFFFEAARRGKVTAWIGAGLSGGLAIYFYPTGRLWSVLAATFCVYLLLHGLGVKRLAIARGIAAAALASILVMAPFFVVALKYPGIFTRRALETSIFHKENLGRLPYYRPEWSTGQLLAAQSVRSLSLLNRIGDHGGFWPTERPILSHPLAVLTLIGLGWSFLCWKDPRFVGLTLWFLFGFAGVVVTVETPSLQRMATAVPVLALFPALVLDDLAKRVEGLAAGHSPDARRALNRLATVGAVLVAAWLMRREARFYFVDYARMDRWSYTRTETEAIRSQGKDTLVISVGRSFHQVNSGWVRLMAVDIPRAGVPSPGSDLPLALPADKNLAFVIYPDQLPYLPYIRELYPGGMVRRWVDPSGSLVVTTYRLSRASWAATQGALARTSYGDPFRVRTLGEAPSGWTSSPSRMRWTAGLRVPRYWTYGFQVGPGPAKLFIDGLEVVAVPAGTSAMSATIALARGTHALVYDGYLSANGEEAIFRWVPLPESTTTPSSDLLWQPVSTKELTASMATPLGLLGVIRTARGVEQRRIDGTLATCCLSDEVGEERYMASWTGTLTAPRTGEYQMALFCQGAADLKLDGRSVIRTNGPVDRPVTASLALAVGAHSVELAYSVEGGRGGLEWTWTPPGGETSIVPPSILSPPPQAGIAQVVPAGLGASKSQPLRSPLVIVR